MCSWFQPTSHDISKIKSIAAENLISWGQETLSDLGQAEGSPREKPRAVGGDDASGLEPGPKEAWKPLVTPQKCQQEPTGGDVSKPLSGSLSNAPVLVPSWSSLEQIKMHRKVCLSPKGVGSVTCR